jgi:hypothetical protein
MSQPSRPTYQVFISYSTKDKPWADSACAVLERNQIRCWIAPRDITPGTEWGEAIIAGIDACKIMVLIFSANANESAQVRRETERAISKGLAILPCRVEDVKPAGAMEYALSNTHWLDAFTPPVEQQMELLAESVQALLARGEGMTLPQKSQPDTAPRRPAPRSKRLLVGGAAACILLLGFVGAWAAGVFKGKGSSATPAGEPPHITEASVPRVAEKPAGIPRFPATMLARDTGKWRVANDYLEQTTLDENVYIAFGDKTWTDYDFVAEGLLVRGNDQCCLVFRLSSVGNFCLFGLGSFKNTCHSAEELVDNKRFPASGPVKVPGKLNAGVWNKMAVRVRGDQAQCYLNDLRLFDVKIRNSAGEVGFRTWASTYRFRNIKVTDPSGKVLLEGLPEL